MSVANHRRQQGCHRGDAAASPEPDCRENPSMIGSAPPVLPASRPRRNLHLLPEHIKKEIQHCGTMSAPKQF